MKCFVCGSDMNHYFDKNFGQEISGTQEKHEFVKCCNCGMVVDKFLYDIPKKDWEELNFSNHKSYHENYTVPEEDEVDPKWKERIKDQIRTLKEFLDSSFIPKSASIVDFGCGNGMLADGFNGGTAYEIKKYEKYMASIFPEKDYLTDDELKETSWDIVITCSVLEHIVGREDLDALVNLLNGDNGIFVLHTLICDAVPCDPGWFYLVPGHCTLYTNKAMSMLFEQYGFKGCAYHPDSRFWFFFKNEDTMDLVKKRQHEMSGEWVFNSSFVDYWKINPYRSNSPGNS